jgi:hypothetical protein
MKNCLNCKESMTIPVRPYDRNRKKFCSRECGINYRQREYEREKAAKKRLQAPERG